MRYHSIRRRIAEFFRRDWLEISLVIFGAVVLIAGVLFAYLTIFVLLHLNDVDLDAPVGEGFIKGSTWIAVGLFGALTILCFAGGWGLVGRRVYRWATSQKRRGQSS